MTNDTGSVQAHAVADLQAAFGRLDALLAAAGVQARQLFPDDDAFRGLHVDAAEVERLLARPPGQALLWSDAVGATLPPCPAQRAFARLRQSLALGAFELDVLLLALAPEFDLRYERLYGFLQDDITRKRPQLDLALNLLCRSAPEKLARRASFLPDAPLIRQGLVQLVGDEDDAAAPALACQLHLDEQVVGWLLGRDDLHPLLRHACRSAAPTFGFEQLVLPADTARGLAALARHAKHRDEALLLSFEGPAGVGKRCAAHALAQAIGAPLLEVDCGPLFAETPSPERLAMLVAREARVRDAVVYLDRAGADERVCRIVDELVATLAERATIVIAAGDAAQLPAGRADAPALRVHLPMPEAHARLACWRAQLAAAGVPATDAVSGSLATRFRLTPGKIARAVGQARVHALWRAATHAGAREAGTDVQTAELEHAARAQAGQALARLARKIEPRHGWADLVLPADALAQLHEICGQVLHRATVYDDWGFDRTLSLGRGVVALFFGPPGTGKTLAAEILAAELGLDLYQIDLARVVSKYIGDTEKNLGEIFAAAEDANAILFFDEADALFGKRSEVKDAHDRYANIEVGYLLQKMEEYEGIAILATNLRQHLDGAFVRRMQAIVEFPFPDEPQRHRIWCTTIPPEAPLAADVDLYALARDVRLAGGNIKNIVLAAAFFAAADGAVIGRQHLARAVRREHQKLGRAWSEPEWAPAARREPEAA